MKGSLQLRILCVHWFSIVQRTGVPYENDEAEADAVEAPSVEVAV